MIDHKTIKQYLDEGGVYADLALDVLYELKNDREIECIEEPGCKCNDCIDNDDVNNWLLDK